MLRNALLLSLLSALSNADVLVVAPGAGPGIDATTIQGAISVAKDGDTILVRDGAYGAFTLFGKGVSIVADGDDVHVASSAGRYGATPAISVAGLGQGQQVLVRGLKLNFGVFVYLSSGHVWFDQIDVRGDLTTGPCGGGAPGAMVTNSQHVTFTGCQLVGDEGKPPYGIIGAAAGVGVFLDDSDVTLIDCQVSGGPGASTPGIGYSGGSGLRTQGTCVVVLSGTSIEGGAGGVASASVCSGPNGIGGVGVWTSPYTIVYSLESTAAGGVADLTVLCPGQYGPTGSAIIGSGTIAPLFGYARSLSTESPVRGGTNATFTATGQPGELPILLLSHRQDPVLFSAFSGTLLIGLPFTDVFVLPTIPSNGTTTYTLPVPNLATGLDSLTYYAQAIYLDLAQAPWIGGACALTLIDASY